MIDILTKLYPGTIVGPEISDSRYTTIKVQGQTINIPRRLIGHKELVLLDVIDENKSLTPFKGAWGKFFDGEINPPDIEYPIRFLYLNTDPVFDYRSWLEDLKGVFPNFCETVNINKFLFVIVIKGQTSGEFVDLLEVNLKELDLKYSTHTRCMLGQLIFDQSLSKRTYDKESLIFDEFLNHTDKPKVFTHTQALLAYLLAQIENIGDYIPNIKHYLNNNTNYHSIITALYEQSANITKASQSIGMKRNTFIYWLKKFTRETSYDLTNFYDLSVCYFVVKLCKIGDDI